MQCIVGAFLNCAVYFGGIYVLCSVFWGHFCIRQLGYVDVSGMCSVFLYCAVHFVWRFLNRAVYFGGIFVSCTVGFCGCFWNVQCISVLCSIFGVYFCVVHCIWGVFLYCAVYFGGVSVLCSVF